MYTITMHEVERLVSSMLRKSVGETLTEAIVLDRSRNIANSLRDLYVFDGEPPSLIEQELIAQLLVDSAFSGKVAVNDDSNEGENE